MDNLKICRSLPITRARTTKNRIFSNKSLNVLTNFLVSINNFSRRKLLLMLTDIKIVQSFPITLVEDRICITMQLFHRAPKIVIVSPGLRMRARTQPHNDRGEPLFLIKNKGFIVCRYRRSGESGAAVVCSSLGPRDTGQRAPTPWHQYAGARNSRNKWVSLRGVTSWHIRLYFPRCSLLSATGYIVTERRPHSSASTRQITNNQESPRRVLSPYPFLHPLAPPPLF